MRSSVRMRFGSELARFFDRVHCINLDSRPDRWAHAASQFDAFGLTGKVERASATDVRNDPGLQAHNIILRNNFSLLAMCGCMLSHRKLVESARRSGLQRILIFEDDIRILEDNIDELDQSLFDLSGLEWDVFYLGATYLWEIHPVGSHLVNATQGAYATHAIAYNHSVYDRILDILPSDPLQYVESNGLELPALDKWLQSELFDHRKFYGTNPIMVVQGLQESDIALNQQAGIEQAQIELFRKNLVLQHPKPRNGERN